MSLAHIYVGEKPVSVSNPLPTDPIGIPAHDAEVYTYVADGVETIVYKTGGVAGTTVATMTFAYADGKCTSRALALS
jgi:hypothetical protein